jgi:hypothetical protein
MKSDATECKMRVTVDGEIDIVPYAKGLWMVTRPLSFWVDSMMFTVPVGFIFDGATIPKPLRWWSAPINGWSDTAAAIHDYLYRYRTTLGITRRFADDVFLIVMGEAARKNNIRSAKPIAKYIAVRWFGWLVGGKGDGTPPRKVRRGVERQNKKGEQWAD